VLLTWWPVREATERRSVAKEWWLPPVLIQSDVESVCGGTGRAEAPDHALANLLRHDRPPVDHEVVAHVEGVDVQRDASHRLILLD